MKAILMALILTLFSLQAMASFDASVFTNKVFTSMDNHDPQGQHCEYHLMIKEDRQGDLHFYTQEYGKSETKLWFTVKRDELQNAKDTPTQKYFNFQSAPYYGFAYYGVHSSQSPNDEFYQIVINARTAFTSMACEYSLP